MMQSLRGRLIVLVALLCVAGAAASGLMIGLFFQSASAQAGQAQAEVARACDAIASTYRFYSTRWQDPKTSMQDTTLRSGLTAVAQTSLRNRFGIEGGLWTADTGSLAYAYPTYQGAGNCISYRFLGGTQGATPGLTHRRSHLAPRTARWFANLK